MQEVKYFENDFVYDLETYPNIFTFCIVRADGKHLKVFEVSDRKNQTAEILNALRYLMNNKCRMVGFNNLGFDYPILHQIMLDASAAKRRNKPFTITAEYCYALAQMQIESFKDGFGHTIKADEMLIRQVDLFKINHFDNKAKSTSLKMIEFNMRSATIEDLPFHHSKKLNSDQMDVLIEYNKHDVVKTLEFYYENYKALQLRIDLSEKYGIDFTNHNDTKIGKDFFIQMLEKKKPGTCYKMLGEKKVLNRTVRDKININECLFNYYDFKRPEFIAVKNWFSKQVITETKGVFTDLPEHVLGDVAKYARMIVKKKRFKGKPSESDIAAFKKQYPMGWVQEEQLKAMVKVLDEFGQPVKVQNEKGKLVNLMEPKKSYWMMWRIAESLNVVVDGFEFVFGVGGIHGSLETAIIVAKENESIKDADVASMYPNLAIKNRVYPEHLGEGFCDIYENVYEQRKGFAKGTPENAAMKLALNGVYGDSNNQFSPFFDSKYTMTITINGQLSLCLFAERLMQIEGLRIVQVNTDGVTVVIPKDKLGEYDKVCSEWMKITKLDLEFADYSKMFIRDVNNYIALYTNGKVKRKGAYQYEDLGWHQNQGGLVIPKAAEANLLYGTDIAEYIKAHEDEFDFMLRTKVPKSSRLVLELEDGYQLELQNTCRYYVCKTGGKLVKLMPPTESQLEEGKTDERRIGLEAAWKVKPCNNMKDFSWNIDYDYYVSEAQKLASLVPEESQEEDE